MSLGLALVKGLKKICKRNVKYRLIPYAANRDRGRHKSIKTEYFESVCRGKLQVPFPGFASARGRRRPASQATLRPISTILATATRWRIKQERTQGKNALSHHSFVSGLLVVERRCLIRFITRLYH